MDDEMRIFKRLFLGLALWSLMSVVTYGHILKQFRQETAQCIASTPEPQRGGCDATFVRMDAFMASLFWPQHWSEMLWK